MRAPLIALCLALVAFASVAAAPEWQGRSEDLQPVPALTGRVVDLTNTLSGADKQALEAKLADWEARTTNQLVVLLVATTQPEPIESYSIRVAEAWKIGRRGQDNGALFVVAKDDKKMRIEVGYGLEGTLTDVTAHRIITETVAPLFSKGQFAAGITAGVDRIIQVVGSGQPLPEKPQPRARSGGHVDFGMLLILLFIVVPFVGGLLQRMLGKLLGSTVGAGVVGFAAWIVAGSMAIAIFAAIIGFIVMIFSGLASAFGNRGVFIPGGRWGGGWGGGGWSSGGGGFSGGGGSFGGGGASGGWN
ncbi:MAG TPA: YgcG family protein [Casimicrobiaceae bacterium]|nr:YgcG family protein [Casimicrobiaceae bacterium]